MSHDYKCWHKALSKELCEYMDCFESNPDVETLCIVEKLSKTMVKLYEMEAYEIMFDCLEDCFGYDRDEHEFEDKDNGGVDYVLYAVMNRYDPTRMTSGTSHYPTTTRGGQSYGRDYGTGADHRYGERYNDRSTDKSMYQPYSMDYGYGMGGWMNMADGDRNRMMDDRRTGERNGERNGDRNGSRDRDWDSRSGERGMERGRYLNAAERKETKDRMKKLSDEDKKRWVSDMVSFDGSVGGPWSMSEVEAVAKRIGIKYEDFTPSDLFVAANLLYTDMGEALSNQPNANKPETWIKMAALWLSDEDGLKGDERLAVYYHNIVDDDD